MSRIIVLDSGPLGMVTNPKAKSVECQQCQTWLEERLVQGDVVALPEISDYEVRRELIRANRLASIRRLDQFKALSLYLPITTSTMLKAAELWAQVRQAGQSTADPKALDGDVILAAQVVELFAPNDTIIVATTNVSHLSRFVDAQFWQSIS